MEASREIYWNVGHSWMTLLPMYLVTIVAMAVLVYGFMLRLKVYKQGKAINRTDNIGERLTAAMQDVLLQGRVIRVRWPGRLNGVFFWGFFLLLIGTTIIVIQADFTDLLFGVNFERDLL